MPGQANPQILRRTNRGSVHYTDLNLAGAFKEVSKIDLSDFT